MNKEKAKAIIILMISLVGLIALNWSRIPKIDFGNKKVESPYNTFYTQEWDISTALEDRLAKVGVDTEIDITIIRFTGGYVIDNIMVFAEDSNNLDIVKSIINQSVQYEGKLSFYVKEQKNE